jgi:hypothetical protein
MPPYIEVGATPRGGGASYIEMHDQNIIWSANFRALPLSTSSNAAQLRAALATMGLTFTRASSATVQTSASAVVTSGIGVDDPRVGDAGYGRGLVIEEAQTGRMPDSENQSGYSVGAGTPTVTANSDVAPDGTTTADTVTDDDAGVFEMRSRSGAVPTDTATYRVRVCIKKQVAATARIGIDCGLSGGTAVAKSMRFNAQTGVGNADVALVEDMGAYWRVTSAPITNNGTNANAYIQFYPAVGTVAGADVASATGSATVWGFEFVGGNFATEYIPTTGAAATRLGDRLSVGAGRIVRSGRVGVEFRFLAKSATSAMNGGAAVTLLGNAGAQSYANISTDALGRVLQLNVGGALVTLGTTIAWAAGDLVDMWVELGGGSLVSSGAYRVNGGAKLSLGSTGAPHGAVTDSAFDLLNFTALSQVASWVQRICAYAPGTRPAWAA